jgi:hypothetical protein
MYLHSDGNRDGEVFVLFNLTIGGQAGRKSRIAVAYALRPLKGRHKRDLLNCPLAFDLLAAADRACVENHVYLTVS